MDTNNKVEKILEMMEHPEKYAEDDIRSLLDDEECREYYDALVEAKQAMTAGKSDMEIGMPNVEEEWEKFSRKQHFSSTDSWHKVAAIIAIVLCVSALSFATINVVKVVQKRAKPTQPISVQEEKVGDVVSMAEVEIVTSDSVALAPIVYDNVELSRILDDILKRYHQTMVVYENTKAKNTRLYLQVDSGMTLDDVMEMLNHFENFTIVKRGDNIFVK